MDKKIIEDHNTSMLALGHSIILIVTSTEFLKDCYDDKNYYPLEEYKDVENFLNTQKSEMDYTSYLLNRKKISH